MYILFFLYTVVLGLYFLSFFPKTLPFLVKAILVYLLGTIFLTVLFFVCYPLLAVSEWFLYLPFGLLLIFFFLSRWHLVQGATLLKKSFTDTKTADLLVLLFVLSFSSFLFFKTIWQNKLGQTLIAGKLWSDFGAHIPLIKSFSVGFNFPPQYPLFPQEAIRYHFFFDFLSAVLEKLGLPLSWAINIPSILSFSALLILIYYLGVLIFSRRSVGVLAVFLTLFNSSFAFLSLSKKIPFTGNIALWLSQIIHHKEFLAFGPYDQGIVSGFWNLNIYTNQRHFAFALAVLVLLIYLFFHCYSCYSRSDRESINKDSRWSLPRAATRGENDMGVGALFIIGCTIGLLPVIHSGVFLIAVLCLPIFFVCMLQATAVVYNIRQSLILTTKYFILLILPLVLVSLPQILYFELAPTATGAGINFRPGYLEFVNFQWINFTRFWIYNLGLTLFFAPLGFLLAPKKMRLLFLLSFLPFAVGNLFSFSPDIATNHKFFNFSVIIFNFYTAYFIVQGATLPRWHLGKKTVVLIFFLTLSGLLDLFPIFNDTFFAVPDLNQKADIVWIEKNTPKRAIFANSYYLYHPASLAGRPIVLGWPYFSWSAGYDTNLRDKQLRDIYRANQKQPVCFLLNKLNVSFVTVSTLIKDESTTFDLFFWQKNFPLVYQNPQSGFYIFSVDTCHSRSNPRLRGDESIKYSSNACLPDRQEVRSS